LDALGPYGFRDAIDYTRPARGARYAVVRTFMAHHVGMTIVALTNVLLDRVWQRRFHAEPLVRSAELLLHERIPRRLSFQPVQSASVEEALPDPELDRPAVREIDTPDTPQPVIALLGHLPYTLLVTNAGAGYSRFEGLAVTRWRADGTRDATGQFCYIKDVTRNRVWSVAHQPTRAPANWYRVLLATDRVTFTRVDGDVETRTEIAAVPGDAAEVRRVTLTNSGREPRELELTSYGEVVLAPPDADRAHPAFGNLFVETEYHPWCTAVTATRRPRASTERRVWLVHVVAAGPEQVGAVTCETDRARFIGRGRSTADPAALDRDGPLAGTTGAVLDPIVALRTRIRLEPGQSTSVAFTTLVATSAEQAYKLADRYRDPHAAQRALDLAWTAAQIELRDLQVSPSDAAVYQELGGHLLHRNLGVCAPRGDLDRNRGSQALLWAQGVSGDWPILLVTIESAAGLPTLRQVLVAHHYWRRRGLIVDVVVLDANPSTYQGAVHERVTSAILASSEAGLIDRSGGVFVRRRDQLDEHTLLMLRATARVHIECDGRRLAQHLVAAEARDEAARPESDEWEATPDAAPRASSRVTPRPVRVLRRLRALADGTKQSARQANVSRESSTPVSAQADDLGAGRWDSERTPLLLDNGLGGLTAEGDYEIRLHDGRLPPAPWANVVANMRGGFLVTERGSSCTWAENSQFFRLTPWHNDPVTDPASEVLYLRDEESGEVWSATPAPYSPARARNAASARPGSTFVVRHGAGASSFEHAHDGIATQLTMGMAGDEPVKVFSLRITNTHVRARRISVTAYVEWCLGVLREHTQHQVCTSFDPDRSAIFARNSFHQQFGEWVAFCALSEPVAAYTGDRQEFLGRNGSADDPDGMGARELSGDTGAGHDPCAALRCVLELGPLESRDLSVILGAAPDEAAALRAVDQHRSDGSARFALARSRNAWEERLSVIQVRTPEPSFDAMINRWALYQALSCRMWGRTALYQSSGAYGFRDQLQDAMAFVYAEPAVAREHLLRAASRQFVEGDVQHWWHPPSGRGVRTRFSDDLVWLPYVVDQYVRVTGDATVLDDEAPFLSMRALEPHEHEVFDLPQVANERGSVYEHCLRALRKACTAGEHGLPLIGVGDWNDGMNRVGVEGRGESVWLAWFLVTTLRAFAAHAEAREDSGVAEDLRRRADAYVAAVEAHAWDGAWYRRAYFDDGSPLGSAQDDECRIDSIAQSWSVISAAGDPARQEQAMRSLEEHLVRDDARLIVLLQPPFDKTPRDPGYIKGYLPGVRENGAQYTHAALWTVLATALRGDGDRAFELYQMLNPLTHARTPDEVETYKVEPYVVAADVYTASGHLGRGGWTWYTGSASWMYRVALEAILGFTKHGETLTIDPCVPRHWQEFTIEYRYGRSLYVITVRTGGQSTSDAAEVSVDGQPLDPPVVPLVDDGARHEVLVLTRPAATRLETRELEHRS
jgi:cyclic beta-1,2-glucan synthetase